MAIDFSQVKAICFDVDGTLSDTDDQFVKNLVRLFKPAMLVFHQQDVLSMARRLVMLTEGPGTWLYGFADKFGLDGKIVALGDRLYDKGVGESVEPFHLIDGVWQMLVTLRNRYPLSIVSNRGQRSTLRFLFQFELVPFFTAVATGQTCRHAKPYPDPIFWAADKMGVAASSCLMIGDTVTDILAGKKAGAQTAGVLCGFGDENELRHAGADDILKNTADLIDLIS
jgi:N-acetyl-D-muramate 6-phosphate phosphatase